MTALLQAALDPVGDEESCQVVERAVSVGVMYLCTVVRHSVLACPPPRILCTLKALIVSSPLELSASKLSCSTDKAAGSWAAATNMASSADELYRPAV